MAEDYLNSQHEREQHCANASRDTMLKWALGGAVVFGGGTYLAHLYCQLPVTHHRPHGWAQCLAHSLCGRVVADAASLMLLLLSDPPVTRLNFRFKVIPVCSQPTTLYQQPQRTSGRASVYIAAV